MAPGKVVERENMLKTKKNKKSAFTKNFKNFLSKLAIFIALEN